MDIRTPVQTIYGDWLPRFENAWAKQIEMLKSKFGKSVSSVEMPPKAATDVPIVWVKKEEAIELLKFVKTEPGFEYNFLSDITATDETPRKPRFNMVYNLFSTTQHWRIRVKVKLAEDEEMPTAIPVWPGANWAEREVFDMFGVRFSGHPDLRRILLDERWKGHPLRKDYPLKGYQIFEDPMPARKELLE